MLAKIRARKWCWREETVIRKDFLHSLNCHRTILILKFVMSYAPSPSNVINVPQVQQVRTCHGVHWGATRDRRLWKVQSIFMVRMRNETPIWESKSVKVFQLLNSGHKTYLPCGEVLPNESPPMANKVKQSSNPLPELWIAQLCFDQLWVEDWIKRPDSTKSSSLPPDFSTS